MRNNDNPLANAVNRAAGADPQGGGAKSPRGARVPRSRKGKKGVLLHVDPEIAKRLKLLAVEQDTTIEALGIKALGLLFERYDQQGGTGRLDQPL